MKTYYVMVDRPAQVIQGHRHNMRYINKPRREHRTLMSAVTEAERLSKKCKSRALVLEVVFVTE